MPASGMQITGQQEEGLWRLIGAVHPLWLVSSSWIPEVASGMPPTVWPNVHHMQQETGGALLNIAGWVMHKWDSWNGWGRIIWFMIIARMGKGSTGKYLGSATWKTTIDLPKVSWLLDSCFDQTRKWFCILCDSFTGLLSSQFMRIRITNYQFVQLALILSQWISMWFAKWKNGYGYFKY